jgi:hypothetical protein
MSALCAYRKENPRKLMSEILGDHELHHLAALCSSSICASPEGGSEGREVTFQVLVSSLCVSMATIVPLVAELGWGKSESPSSTDLDGLKKTRFFVQAGLNPSYLIMAEASGGKDAVVKQADEVLAVHESMTHRQVKSGTRMTHVLFGLTRLFETIQIRRPFTKGYFERSLLQLGEVRQTLRTHLRPLEEQSVTRHLCRRMRCIHTPLGSLLSASHFVGIVTLRWDLKIRWQHTLLHGLRGLQLSQKNLAAHRRPS